MLSVPTVTVGFPAVPLAPQGMCGVCLIPSLSKQKERPATAQYATELFCVICTFGWRWLSMCSTLHKCTTMLLCKHTHTHMHRVHESPALSHYNMLHCTVLQNNSLDGISELQYGHWLATATQLPDGRIIVMSDSPVPVAPPQHSPIQTPFYEIWDPEHPTEPTVLRQLDKRFIARPVKYFYYPMNYVLPQGKSNCSSTAAPSLSAAADIATALALAVLPAP